jgi:hypothetical protein
MRSIVIESYRHYLEIINSEIDSNKDIILFRGQADNKSLIPSIGRDYDLNIVQVERGMLNELKRRSKLYISRDLGDNDWEWLIYAQQYGMKTRLLDWTSNPLVALWFACKEEDLLEKDAYVYVVTADNSMVVSYTEKGSPFEQTRTRILIPSMNNERIMAQAGYFTVHHVVNNAFVSLDNIPELKDQVSKIVIPSNLKKEVLKSLGYFGISYHTLFPEAEGLCRHLNWEMVTSRHERRRIDDGKS